MKGIHGVDVITVAQGGYQGFGIQVMRISVPRFEAIKKKLRKYIPTHHEPVGAVEDIFSSRN